MTEVEISKALALAIGWDRDYMTLNTGVVRCYYPKATAFDSSWRIFSYTDWSVIGPIAERYDMFPQQSPTTQRWYVPFTYVSQDTPQKAIAMAVIEGAKK
jgi:hypothetical protein